MNIHTLGTLDGLFCKVCNIFSKVKRTDRLIQYSPPRTGSTVVWQIMNQIFPGREIKKTHTPSEVLQSNSWSIITFRDPVDTAISRFRISCDPQNFKSGKYSWSVMEKEILLTQKELESFFKLLQKMDYTLPENIILLHYDDFEDNLGFVFGAVRKKWKKRVEKSIIKKTIENSSQEENLKKSEKFEDFSEHDPHSQIHGNHVYVTDSLKDEVPQEYLEKIKEVLNEEIIEYENLIKII